MIISHKYKFIFIKTTKTAGTSIEVFLSSVCDDGDVVTPIIPHVEPHIARNYEKDGFYNHIPGLKIKNIISDDVWDSYFKFCFERNPWDKTLSHYYMINKRSEHGVSLDEYFEEGKLPIDHGKYTDTNGKIIVDNVSQYENLNKDLTHIFNLLGIPFSGELNVRAKSDYRTDRRHYREVLDIKQAKIVEKAFSKEIEWFGYEY